MLKSGLGNLPNAFFPTTDFEVFRHDLDEGLAHANGSKGSRPPFDPVLMFKILVLQTLHHLSEKQPPFLHSFC